MAAAAERHSHVHDDDNVDDCDDGRPRGTEGGAAGGGRESRDPGSRPRQPSRRRPADAAASSDFHSDDSTITGQIITTTVFTVLSS